MTDKPVECIQDGSFKMGESTRDRLRGTSPRNSMDDAPSFKGHSFWVVLCEKASPFTHGRGSHSHRRDTKATKLWRQTELLPVKGLIPPFHCESVPFTVNRSLSL